jgi:endonuclease YncB( thermonuclease family)
MDYLLTAAIFGLLLLLIARMDEVSTRTSAGNAQVHDGDTVTVQGQRMRLRGIDAPEYSQTCQAEGRDYACGRDARRSLAALADGKSVTCEGWELDKYQRLLAVCRAGGIDLNAEMVRLGWAVSYGDYRREEAEARQAKRGLWRGEFETPRDWRAQHQPQDKEPPHDMAGSVFNWLRQLIWPARVSDDGSAR